MVPGSWSGSRLNAQTPKPASASPTADIDIDKILKGVEEHYNRVQTLQVSFAESLTVQGHKRTERGELSLRKPGKMRWEYTSPAGKLFISDGKYIYSYFASEKRAERENFKETEDMRAPLAFLLGRLNFHDDFREFRAQYQTQPDQLAHGTVSITAIPKSDKLPYSEVTFQVSPDFVIHFLSVKGQEGSVTEFVFENEKKNPPLNDALFRFTPPPGTEYVDSTKH
jgi:outer membrane lipoprotein carrier protein